jgi:hypothetical protein
MSKRRRGWWKGSAGRPARPEPSLLEELQSGRTADVLPDADIQPFLIDNVAEYLYAGTDKEVWKAEEDFPCLAPPFPCFWMEFHQPSKIVSSVPGWSVSHPDRMPYRIGLLFTYTEADELGRTLANNPDAARRRIEEIYASLKQSFTPEIGDEILAMRQASAGNMRDPRWRKLSRPARIVLTQTLELNALETALKPGGFVQALAEGGARWIMTCHSFAQMKPRSPILGPLGVHDMQITGDGRVVEDTRYFSFNSNLRDWTKAPEAISSFWLAGLLAISFCACKNVLVKSAEEPAVPRPVPPQGRHLTFKVLEIGPMKTILDRTASEHHTGLQRALHICRGHFAIYEEKPLFGKYRGRFWIPQHVRGSIEAGVVVKDYDVAGPAEKEEPSAPERKGL